ncbi:MAG: hypothetical protein IJ193_03220 [Bacilli bacterium]|nr:hypothetical protein [Bacilli bacterium]
MKKNNAVTTTIIVTIITIVLFGGGIVFIANSLGDGFESNYDRENKELFSELSFEIPEGFKEDDYSTMKFVSYDNNSVYFNLDITAREKSYYKTAEEFLKDEVYFSLDDEVGELKEEEINGIKMVTLEAKKKYGDEYYYSMESSNYIYFFKFNIRDYEDGDREDIDSNPCLTAKNKILYSIKLK